MWRNTVANNAFIIRGCNFFLGLDKGLACFMGDHCQSVPSSDKVLPG